MTERTRCDRGAGVQALGPRRGAARRWMRRLAVVVALGAAIGASATAPPGASDPGSCEARAPENGSPVARLVRATGNAVRYRPESGGERLRRQRAEGAPPADCAGCAGRDAALARLGWRASTLAATAVGEED